MLPVPGMESVTQHKASTNVLMLEHTRWCKALVDGYLDKSSFLEARLTVACTLSSWHIGKEALTRRHWRGGVGKEASAKRKHMQGGCIGDK